MLVVPPLEVTPKVKSRTMSDLGYGVRCFRCTQSTWPPSGCPGSLKSESTEFEARKLQGALEPCLGKRLRDESEDSNPQSSPTSIIEAREHACAKGVGRGTGRFPGKMPQSVKIAAQEGESLLGTLCRVPKEGRNCVRGRLQGPERDLYCAETERPVAYCERLQRNVRIATNQEVCSKATLSKFKDTVR